MPINILFVDASSCVHKAAKWVLKDEPYRIIAFTDPFEALKALGKEEFAVAIADQWLHEMNGIEFLKSVNKQSPNTIGIVITTFVETKEAIDALKSGYVFQFVKKPLESKIFKQAVKMAISNYDSNHLRQSKLS